MRNESRKARVAARSSWASRSRSSCGGGRPLARRSRSSVAKAGCRSGTRPCSLDQLVAERLGERDLVLRGAAERRAPGDVIASWAGAWASCRSAVNTGVRIARPEDHAEVAGADRPAGVRDARQAHRASPAEVSRSTVSPSPRPTSAWGATVQARSADGRSARPTSPPAIRKQPDRDLDLGRRSQEPGERAGGERRDRYDGHGQRGGRRGAAPALDQQQDQQEQRRGERGRQQREGQVGPHRRAMPVRRERPGTARTASAAGTASTANGTCTTKIACHENAWVSRPPATGPVAVPTTPAVTQTRDAAALAVHRDQQLQAADQRERAAERLHAASRDQHVDRAGRRAPRRGAGEHRDPGGAQRSAGCARAKPRPPARRPARARG